MKRFYKEACAEPVAGGSGGFAVLLDGRAVKTPVRKPLVLPSFTLAQQVVAEWNDQAEEIDPRSMPLTGLANAAIDHVSADPLGFAHSLSSYGESDLLCYRAEGPQALAQRQAELWDPLLQWARQRFDTGFEIVRGVMHRAQPERSVEQLGKAVAARNPFQLAGLAPLVTIGGSLLIALALDEGAIDLETAWAAATLDEAWQAENWGEDALATAALEARRLEFEAGYQFLRLL